MSGFLRNTLSLVGKAKYATNISTKYLQIMTLTTSRINNSMLLDRSEYSQAYESKRFYNTEGIKNLINFRRTIKAAVKKILLIITGRETKTSNVGNFMVSYTTGDIGLLRPWFGPIPFIKKLILPPTFSLKFNGETVKAVSNKIAAEEEEEIFKFGKLNVALHGGELKLKTKDSGETFIVNHAIYVEAYDKPQKHLPDVAKMTSDTTILGEFSEFYYPENKSPPVQESDYELTDIPNGFGKVKLRFPMTVSFKGAPQVIKMTNSDDTLIVYHTVDIRADNELDENLKNIKKNQISKIGEFEIYIHSGDLLVESLCSSRIRRTIRPNFYISVDLASAVPSISINSIVNKS